jgi:hypothetical protein
MQQPTQPRFSRENTSAEAVKKQQKSALSVATPGHSRAALQATHLASEFVFEPDANENLDRVRTLQPRNLRPRNVGSAPDAGTESAAWTSRELLFVFNKFGILGQPRLQVELFDRFSTLKQTTNK